MKSSRIPIMLLFAFFTMSAGCAIPRIVILDDPLTAEEHLRLGASYEARGEYDAAISEYLRAEGKTPLAYLYLGNAYFGKNDFESAEANYKKAMDADPSNADAFNNLAWLYYTRRTNLSEAETLASKALEINPSKADVYRDTLEKIRALKREKDL